MEIAIGLIEESEEVVVDAWDLSEQVEKIIKKNRDRATEIFLGTSDRS